LSKYLKHRKGKHCGTVTELVVRYPAIRGHIEILSPPGMDWLEFPKYKNLATTECLYKIYPFLYPRKK